MRKKIIEIGLAAILGLSSISCGSGEEKSNPIVYETEVEGDAIIADKMQNYLDILVIDNYEINVNTELYDSVNDEYAVRNIDCIFMYQGKKKAMIHVADETNITEWDRLLKDNGYSPIFIYSQGNLETLINTAKDNNFTEGIYS